jgi:hypothetical protein
MSLWKTNRKTILFAAVTLVSATVAGGVSLLSPQSAPAATQTPTYRADRTPVRIVGTPFVPNTTPRER